MDHTVFIENADMPFAESVRMAEQIRSEIGTGLLTVIAEGDFRSDGLPAEHSAKQRADGWADAGADLVLQLPVFSTLGGYGKKDFATAALIQRLHSVNRVILPCRPLPGQTSEECGALLRKCAMLMFREYPDYRKRLQENLLRRMSFLRAQMDAVVFCVPDAGELLRYSENRQSVCMLDAMLQLYYIVQVDFLETSVLGGELGQPGNAAAGEEPGQPGSVPYGRESGQPGSAACGGCRGWAAGAALEGQERLQHFEYCAAQSLKEVFENLSGDYLMSISGSTEKAVRRILDLSEEIREKNRFQEITECVEDAFPNMDMARLFLLRVLLNVRHSDMLISGLHTYVPYCRLLKERAERREDIRRAEESSWVPFVRADLGQDAAADETFRILLAIDQRAEFLFR